MRAANRFGGDLYRWRLYSVDGRPVASSSGFPVAVDGALEAARGPVLLVCASYHAEAANSRGLAAGLRERLRRGTLLGGLDTGPLLLARAGLLDGYRATIHWEDLELFAERFPAVDVVPDRFVVDGDRLTAGGGTTALDMILAVIRAQHGHLLAFEVASQFIYDQEHLPSDPQRAVAICHVWTAPCWQGFFDVDAELVVAAMCPAF